MWIGYKSSGSTAYIWRARRNNFDHVLFKRDGCRRALVRAEEAEVWLSIPGTDVLAQTNRGTSTRIHISENEQVGHQPPGDTCQAFKLGACGWPESSQSSRRETKTGRPKRHDVATRWMRTREAVAFEAHFRV